jgi:hypothetical protein
VGSVRSTSISRSGIAALPPSGVRHTKVIAPWVTTEPSRTKSKPSVYDDVPTRSRVISMVSSSKTRTICR